MAYECEVCKDTGMGGWHKPVVGLDGHINMMFLPQPCLCKRGLEILKWQNSTVFNPAVKGVVMTWFTYEPIEWEVTVTTNRQYVALNMEMPNGKKLRFCDGNYVAKVCGPLARLGKKAGTKLMGQTYNEDEIREAMGWA